MRGLNARGADNILVVDDLTDGRKFRNLDDAHFADFMDLEDFARRFDAGEHLGKVEAIFHQGACSDTTEWDGRLMMRLNYEASKRVYALAQHSHAPLIYASSAAVYGASTAFTEDSANEKPLNVYGWSKLVFDRWLARQHPAYPVAGFRYFNVYGPGEGHKGRMASVIHHFDRQVRETGVIRLFAGSHGYADGEQRRDFIYVGDIVAANLWALDVGADGVFNLGTGESRAFNDVANQVIAWHGKGRIEYIPFPDDLKGAYQAFTEADIGCLRAAGFGANFTPLEVGVSATLDAVSTRG